MKKEEVEAPSVSILGINVTGIPDGSTVPGKKLLSSSGERRKLNIELEESEARFRLILENTFEGILIADVSTRKIKYLNPAICAMLGYSHEELQDMSIQQIHSEDDWPFVLSEFEVLSSGSKSMTTNIPCVRKDGKVIYADISVSGLVFEGVKCSAGFFRDVTEKRKSEDAIHFSEKKFRSLFTAMTEGVALHELVRDRDGEIVDYRIIDVNPSYEKSTGIPREKAVGSLASELYGLAPPPTSKSSPVWHLQANHISRNFILPPWKGLSGYQLFLPAITCSRLSSRTSLKRKGLRGILKSQQMSFKNWRP